MTNSQIVAVIITSLLGLIIVTFSIILLCGKGGILIAGYNTMPKEEKETVNVKALGRFLGIIMLPIGLFTPALGIGIVYNIKWIPIVYPICVVIALVFAVIFANNSSRFKKK